MKSIRKLLSLVRFMIVRNISTNAWRWLIIIVYFLSMGIIVAGDLVIDQSGKPSRSINIWDVWPAFLSSPYALSWMFIGGYLIATAEDILNDIDSGILVIIMPRIKSRVVWWISRIMTLGIISQLYSLSAFIFIAFASVFRNTPFSLGDSHASRILLPLDQIYTWYPRSMQIPMPLFCVLVSLYTGLVLWLIGSIGYLFSLFARNSFSPYIFSFSWFFIGKIVISKVPNELSKLTDMTYLLTYSKHYASFSNNPIGECLFIFSVASLLVVVMLLGSIKASMIDV